MAITVHTKGAEPVTYGVMKFPDRVRNCLYRMTGNIIVPLAYFKRDADAIEFLAFLHSLVPGQPQSLAELPKEE